jgi:hypothetical protein
MAERRGLVAAGYGSVQLLDAEAVRLTRDA